MKTYKGWTIQEVYRYDNGKSDWQYYPPNGDRGYIMHYCTFEMVCIEIDEKL